MNIVHFIMPKRASVYPFVRLQKSISAILLKFEVLFFFGGGGDTAEAVLC